MNDKFLDAMIDQSINMMAESCRGKSLTKDELAFIVATQRASEKRDRQQMIPNLIKNSQNVLPLLNSFLGAGK